MKHRLILLFLASSLCAFAQLEVPVFEMYEIVQHQKPMKGRNPFTIAAPSIQVTGPNGNTEKIEGFCDSPDGSVFRFRIMPEQPGMYTYVINGKKSSFTAIPSSGKGPLVLDPDHPTHFIYKKTREHFFWNSTTTYWMLGWKDEAVIRKNLDRLSGLGVNRIRVAINGRAHGGSRWSEPTVVESPQFTFKLNPWVANDPESLDDPGFDVSRFNIPHWQRLDRLVAYAHSKGIIVSLIFYVDGLDHATDPFKRTNMGNADEKRYYAFAAARYRAYPNIMWDIANEYHLFRTPEWADAMGTFLKSKDPGHLISVHGNADFPFRKSPWVDVIMYQSWDECGGYVFVNNARQLQAATGRLLPTINEEYGYEGHYPPWGCGSTATKLKPDGRSGWNRAQLAWEICMAGAYQTTGETAEFGTGAGDDSGGGWINGRGNSRMTMLKYYKTLKDCFEQLPYWEMEPYNQAVSFGNLCLAKPGQAYMIYSRVQHCRLVIGKSEKYSVTMTDPQSGERTALPDADGAENEAWTYPYNLEKPMVFILIRK